MKNFLLLIAILFFLSCKQKNSSISKSENSNFEGNIYTDSTIREIHTLQNERKLKSLLVFLKNAYPEYRRKAAFSLGTLQDSAAIEPLLNLLKNEQDESVKIAAIFSLGQIGKQVVEKQLLEIYEKENSLLVKAEILETLGKCGTQKTLIFVEKLKYKDEEVVLQKGIAKCLTRLGLRGVTSKEMTKKVFEILTTKSISEEVRYWSSFYLTRAKIDLTDFEKEIFNAFNAEGYIYTHINLTLAMGKSKSEKSLEKLLNILKSKSYDYRIRVAAIHSLSKFEYEKVKTTIFSSLADSSLHVSVKAAEYFDNFGKHRDSHQYLEAAKTLSEWRPRSLMFGAALKFSHSVFHKEISAAIISGYQASKNPYEKAALLIALSGNVENYKFIENQAFTKNENVIHSSAIEALANIRQLSVFDSVAAKTQNLYDYFGEIFKKAILSQDAAMISIAANLLRDPKLKFNQFYKNTYFLNQAISRCCLPQDIEAYLELQKTIEFFGGNKSISVPKIPKIPINWNFISTISPNQRAIIQTNKGKIILEFLINEAPVSVNNFLQLAKQGFYDSTFFHRVVPNFVIQGGCPRGDGWGNPETSIHSEFSGISFEEGTVGMASAGKDTEGSQFFIMLAPMLHLDGNYTIFANVVEGIEVAHSIEIGDKILRIIVSNDSTSETE